MGNITECQGCGGASTDGEEAAATWEVQLAATEIARFAGIAAYHTSVIVGGREFYFDSKGIASGPALVSHLLGRPQGFKMEVRKLGWSTYSGAALTEALGPFFAKGSYDVLHKNCNHFTDVALFFLLGIRLHGQFNRAERILVAAEPFSSHFLNHIFRAAADVAIERGDATAAGGWQGYTTNPLAEGFSAEQVFAQWRKVGRRGRGAASRAPQPLACCADGRCHEGELLVWGPA